MRRLLGRILVVVLVVGAVAGGAVAWRTESAVPEPRTAVTPTPLVTPVLSVRRVPTVLAAPVAERRLLADLRRLAGALPADSCLVVEGEDLRFTHRPDAALVPASTQKLLTATAALELLDPKSRFRTTVVAAGAPTAQGVVAGDLHLVGGGDPLLATADYASRFLRQPQLFTDLDQLAAAVQEAGVRRVEGAVVGDESRYDRERYHPSWQRYIPQDQIGPLSALTVNDGFARYPTATDRTTGLEPTADPPAEAAAVLTRLLEGRGVEVVDPPRAGPAPAGAIEVGAVESAPLEQIVTQLLFESDNNTAEMLLKELGRTARRPSTAGGARVVSELLTSLGPARVVDGSGLSLDDRVSCELLIDVFGRAGTGAQLAERLPVAGESGTLFRRYEGTALEGVMRAKTGNLSSVTSLAGIVEDADPPLTFALVANHPPSSSVEEAVDALVQQVGEAMAAWPRGPDLAALGPMAHDG